MSAMCEYDWPGNVRELENALERATIVTTGSVIAPDALPERVTSKSGEHLVRDVDRLDPTLDMIERAYIKWVLESNGGNKTRAAEVLGIDPSTLHRKLQKMDGSL
jgi:two-component system response regulator HydG